MPSLRRLFERTVATYTSLKRDRRALDFDDLEAGALALLRDRRRCMRALARRGAALLVDEFQDTNARQRDLLALLERRARPACSSSATPSSPSTASAAPT